MNRSTVEADERRPYLSAGSPTLLLVHVSSDPKAAVRALSAAARPVRSLFLGQDYRQLRAWRAAMGPAVEWTAAGPLLNRAGADLREPFLALITDLGRQHDSVAWWSSRVSERNTLLSPLFLHCCYLRVAEGQLVSGTMCVVGDSFPVLESIAELARGRGMNARWIGRRCGARRRVLEFLRVCWRIARFVVQAVHRSIHAPRQLDPSELGGPLILISTFVDEASYGKNGAFHDRYFPGLYEWLEARGASTVTVPLRSQSSGSYRSMWRRLRAAQRRFLAPEAYYRASDYVFALREAQRAASLPKDRGLALEGVDVTRLVDAERRRTAFDAGTLEAVLSYRLPRRLAAAGMEPKVAIIPYENMIPEKPFLLGARRFLSATKLVGFQHGALYPLLLCNFVTRGESEFAPLPDRVVCNGELFRDVLVREGLPSTRAVVGPALRYAHLWHESRRPAGRSTTRSLLIPLPLPLDLGVELLVKAALAFAGEPGLEVRLKPHPMGRIEELFRAAAWERLPGNFRLMSGSMESALDGVAVVVALASSSLYEAVAAGKPVVVVGRDAVFDLNPLAFHADLSRVFAEPAEIRSETVRLLELSDDELDAYRRRAYRLLQESFAPVTDDAMNAFVRGLLELPWSGTLVSEVVLRETRDG